MAFLQKGQGHTCCIGIQNQGVQCKKVLESNPHLLQIGILLLGVCSVTMFPVLRNVLFLGEFLKLGKYGA